MKYTIALLLLMSMHSTYTEATPMNKAALYCTALAVYNEAAGEPVVEKSAVAHVVQNRMRDKEFPTTACAVVYQPKQFTDIRKAAPDFNSQAWRDSVQQAAMARAGYSDDPTDGALWFYAHEQCLPEWVRRGGVCKPRWAWSSKMKQLAQLPGHTYMGRTMHPGAILAAR